MTKELISIGNDIYTPQTYADAVRSGKRNWREDMENDMFKSRETKAEEPKTLISPQIKVEICIPLSTTEGLHTNLVLEALEIAKDKSRD
jgi:hypothetical protein